MTRIETIHLTLVFIGDVARADLPRLIQAAESARGPAFRVDFDRAGFWRHNRIVYLAPSVPPAALLDLAARLEQASTQFGIGFDRRAYTPHVTLIRKATCQALRAPPITPAIPWSASEFVLVESLLGPTGARYLPLARFRLS